MIDVITTVIDVALHVSTVIVAFVVMLGALNMLLGRLGK